MTVGFGDEILDRVGAPRIEERCSDPNLAHVALQDRPGVLRADRLGHEWLLRPTTAQPQRAVRPEVVHPANVPVGGDEPPFTVCFDEIYGSCALEAAGVGFGVVLCGQGASTVSPGTGNLSASIMALAIGVTGQQFALMSIRRLDTADHDVARLIRLRALRDSPAAYGSTYEREVRFPPKIWVDRLAVKTNATFLLESPEYGACGIVAVVRVVRAKPRRRYSARRDRCLL
jgi:hypothetical protein